MSEPPALEVSSLSKRYGRALALDRVSFRLRRGETAWLAGANGAGKSTLLRIAASLERASDGEVRIEGRAASEDGAGYRARIAFLGDSPGLYDELTARENLRFVARFAGRRVGLDEALTAFGVAHLADRLARGFSRGEKQRVALARSFLLDAPILLADEPTSSLDADGVALLAAALKERARRADATTLVASHDIELFGGLAARRLTLEHGRLSEVA